MTYEYTGCGLSDIFLKNGFVEKETPYGHSVAIEDLAGLHKAIGRYLAKCARTLTGEEFRFLRRELEVSQKKFGQLFNITDQTVANWEKGTTAVPGWSDKIIKVLYLESIGEKNKNLMALLNFMTELDQEENRKVTFKEKHGCWEMVGAA